MVSNKKDFNYAVAKVPSRQCRITVNTIYDVHFRLLFTAVIVYVIVQVCCLLWVNNLRLLIYRTTE